MTEFQHPGFTIIGDHLAQHRELSLSAIGLATYIQSLPEGAPVDIRTLAAKFREGRERIAAALRELEAYGYIERVRERTDDGKLVTITYSYNNPEATRARRAREAAARSPRRTTGDPAPEEPAPAPPTTAEAEAEPVPAHEAEPAPEPVPEPAPEPAPEQVHEPASEPVRGPMHAPEPTPGPAPQPAPGPAPEPVPGLVPAYEPTPEPVPEPAPDRIPGPTTDPTPGPAPVRPANADPAPRRVPPRPPLPRPRSAEHRQAAAALLAELRRADPRLLLSVRDVHRLAPAVAAWLERGAEPDAVRHTLTTGLPAPLRHPAALLAHRLTALLPPPLPAAPATPAVGHPHPFQTCDSCDRAFRAPVPGHCRDCRERRDHRRQGARPERVAA